MTAHTNPPSADADGPPIIRVDHVTKRFRSVAGSGRRATFAAVDDVSLEIGSGEIVGVAGESGSGKSTLAEMIVGLQRPSGGRIAFEGEDVSHFRGAAKKDFHRRVQIIFQNPFDSMNPRLTVRECVAEPLRIRYGRRYDASETVERCLRLVGLDPPAEFLGKRPPGLSGGQLQRVAIARAIAAEPALLIADEPVSMLDVSLRAGVLELFASLREQLGVSVLYISHDLSTIGALCERLMVMNAGVIVEEGRTVDLLTRPRHPYTQALLAATPSLAVQK